jgi:glutathione synthase/RimK-type ligase-like ATP-grasp enzyme
LPNLGEAAAKALTNKLIMRDRCVKVGIPIPRIPRVNNAEDVEWFFDGPLVLKPANRQASTGVVRVERYEQIKWAWAEAGAADESV